MVKLLIDETYVLKPIGTAFFADRPHMIGYVTKLKLSAAKLGLLKHEIQRLVRVSVCGCPGALGTERPRGVHEGVHSVSYSR